MTKLEQLANELAFLNNDNLNEIAKILVDTYPTRADDLQKYLCWAEFDNNKQRV